MLTMLTMFVRFGTPLSSAEKSAISMRFLLSFNAKEFGKKRGNQKKGKQGDNLNIPHLQTQNNSSILKSNEFEKTDGGYEER